MRILQLSLSQVLGRQFVKPDGVYGPKTRAAIEQFQADFGLPLGFDVAEQLKIVNMTLRQRRRGETRRGRVARPRRGRRGIARQRRAP